MRIALFPDAPRPGNTAPLLPGLFAALAARGHECLVPSAFALLPGTTPYPLLDSEPGKSPGGMRRARAMLLDAAPDLVCALYADASALIFPALLNGTGIPLLLAETASPATLEHKSWMPYERRACLAGADCIILRHECDTASVPGFVRSRVRVIPEYAPPPPTTPCEKEKSILAVVGGEEDLPFCLALLAAFSSLTHASAAPGNTGTGGTNAAAANKNGTDANGWTLRFQVPDTATTLADALTRLAGQVSQTGQISQVSQISRAGQPGHFIRVSADTDEGAATPCPAIVCLASPELPDGSSVLEAWRSGSAVIAPAGCAEARALIRDGENGLLPDGSPHDLARKLSLLVKRPSLRERLGAAGRESLKHHAPEAVFPLWENAMRATAALAGHTALAFPEADEEERAAIALREILDRADPAKAPACLAHRRREDQLAREAAERGRTPDGRDACASAS